MSNKYPKGENKTPQVSEPVVAYAVPPTATNVLSVYQMQILDGIAKVKDDQDLIEIRNIIAKYFSDKALDAVEALCDAGKLSTAQIESWSKEHFRTPYKK